MPSEGELQNFAERWLRTVDAHIETMFGNRLNSLPRIELSKETPIEERGDWEDNRVRNELERLMDEYGDGRDFPGKNDLLGMIRSWHDSLDVRPNFENMPIDFGNGNGIEDSIIRGILSDPRMTAQQREYAKGIVKRAKDILFRRRIFYKVTAKYFSGWNKITLYYNNIETRDYLYWLRMVLAHEMFHAYHYQTVGEIFKENSGEAAVVKEALADFYSVAFTLDENSAQADGLDIETCIRVAMVRQINWRIFRLYDFPYANARFVTYDGSDCKFIQDENIAPEYWDKFKRVLSISGSNMYQAYCELVPKDERRIERPRARRQRRAQGQTELEKDTAARQAQRMPGFVDDEDIIWKVIKDIIKRTEPATIDELHQIIPEDVLKIIPGRFITLESGEIISAYPQWRVLDREKLLDIAAKLGIVEKFKLKDLIEEEKAALDTFSKVVSRDYSKYSFAGKDNLSKGRTVLEVIKKYVEDHKGISLTDIQKAFPKSILGTYEICEKRMTKDRNYFCAPEDVITLNDGTEMVVCNQWTLSNFTKFVEQAEKYGYIIEKTAR